MIRWHWLIVCLILGMKLGMDIQKRLDSKLISVLKDTVNECKDVLSDDAKRPKPKLKSFRNHPTPEDFDRWA